MLSYDLLLTTIDVCHLFSEYCESRKYE